MAATVGRLKKRADFLRVAAARRKFATSGLVLQAARSLEPDGGIRVGFTASRKVGGAVQRNKARRRLRAAVSDVMGQARPDMDYVLIARHGTLTRPYAALVRDLETALKRLSAWQAPGHEAGAGSGRQTQGEA